MNAMEDLIANKISTLLSLQSVPVATNQFEEIASMLWDLNGILSTLHALTARSPLLEETSSSSEENHTVRLIIINKRDLFAPDAENRSLDDVLTHSRRNGILNTSFVRSA